jgi:putative MATE family efflux protein
LISFSLPMFAGSLLQAMHSIANSIWVGRFLGPEALGAVSLSFPMIMALLALVMGLTMATTILVAQYRGANNEPMVRRTVSSSMALLAVLGVALSVIGVVFRGPLIALVSPPPELKGMATSYFGIFMAGMIFSFMYNVLTALLRGLGDAKTPLYFLVVSTGINIALDPLLILGVGPLPKMGVNGAAVATIIAQAASSLLLLGWVRKNTNMLPATLAEWKVDGALIKAVVKIGMPSGIQQALVSFGMVFVTAIVSSFGSTAIAAYGAASRFDQFGFMPPMAIGMAVSSMVGQNMGAGDHDRVKATVRWATIITVAVTAVLSAIAMAWPRILMVLFTDDVHVLAEGSSYLRYMGPAYIAFAMIFIYGGAMRGAGDTVPPMIFAVLALWVFRVPLAYWFSRSMGTSGVWLGIAVSAFVGMAIHWAYYATGRWRKAVITRRPPPAVEASSAD